MSISVRCENPACRHAMRVRDALAGRRVRCSACKQIVQVPDPSAPEEAPPPNRPAGWPWFVAGGAALLLVLAIAGLAVTIGQRLTAAEQLVALEQKAEQAEREARQERDRVTEAAAKLDDAERAAKASDAQLAALTKKLNAAAGPGAVDARATEYLKKIKEAEQKAQKHRAAVDRLTAQLNGPEKPAALDPPKRVEPEKPAVPPDAPGGHTMVNIYTVPVATEFGVPDVEVVANKITRKPRQAKGAWPLRLAVRPERDEFWFRVPAILGTPGKGLEVEAIPHVLLLEAQASGAVDFQAMVDSLKGRVLIPGGTFYYGVFTKDVPANLFVLCWPKNASLQRVQALYPPGKSFQFARAEAQAKLAGSTLPKHEHAAYVDLLERGGAIIYPRQDGKKVHLLVQPGGRLRAVALGNVSAGHLPDGRPSFGKD